MKKIILISLAGILAFAGGMYIASQKLAPKEANQLSAQPVSQPPPTVNSEKPVVPNPSESTPAPKAPPPTAVAEWQNAEALIAEKLSSCTPFQASFVNPITNERLTKEIIGLVAGKCEYHEEFPNNGNMKCLYTEEERRAVAQFYKDEARAKSLGVSVSGTSHTYTIDGKKVTDPVQEALINKICVISGY